MGIFSYLLNHKNMKERMISRVISKHDLTNTVGCDAGDNNIPIIPKNSTKFVPKPLNDVIQFGDTIPGDGFIFNISPLLKLLRSDKYADIPICIITVQGRMRKGKSFLLNQIAKYLKLQPKDGDWSWLDSTTNPFPWARGPERQTSGIHFWNTPCIITHGEQKIAVLLLDTQGLQDAGTDINDAIKIVAISTLISSVLIYNENVDTEDSVKTLYNFVQCTETTKGDTKENTEKFELGKFILLFRDWEHEEEYPYQLYTKDAESPNLRWDFFENPDYRKPSESALRHRKAILDAFSNVMVYTMASPGTASQYPDRKGHELSKSWHPDFRNSLVEFVKIVCNCEFIFKSRKELYGEPVTGSSLADYIDGWKDKIRSHSLNFRDTTWFDSHVDLYFKRAIDKSFQMYSQEFTKANVSDLKMLGEKHQEILDKIEKDIWEKTNCRQKRERYIQLWLAKVNRKYTNLKSDVRGTIMQAKVDSLMVHSGVCAGAIGAATTCFFILAEASVIVAIPFGTLGVAVALGGACLAMKGIERSRLSSYENIN